MRTRFTAETQRRREKPRKGIRQSMMPPRHSWGGAQREQRAQRHQDRGGCSGLAMAERTPTGAHRLLGCGNGAPLRSLVHQAKPG